MSISKMITQKITQSEFEGRKSNYVEIEFKIFPDSSFEEVKAILKSYGAKYYTDPTRSCWTMPAKDLLLIAPLLTPYGFDLSGIVGGTISVAAPRVLELQLVKNEVRLTLPWDHGVSEYMKECKAFQSVRPYYKMVIREGRGEYLRTIIQMAETLGWEVKIYGQPDMERKLQIKFAA